MPENFRIEDEVNMINYDILTNVGYVVGTLVHI